MVSHLSEFTLVPASQEQILVARKRQVTTWGRGMSEEEFLYREVQLEGMEHASDGKLIAWVLVPRDDPRTLDFKCSCETFRRRALVARPSSSPEEATGYGIASVFCPPEYRRKGYASHMMRLLHHVLSPPGSLPPFPQEWGAPPPSYPREGGGAAQFSVLYSDVGDFYKRCGPSPHVSGWHIHAPFSTTWKLADEDAKSLSLLVDQVEPEFLSEAECGTLWETDGKYIAERLAQLPASPRTRFTFLPTDGVAAFLISRSLVEKPLHPDGPLEHWGVSVIQEDGSPPVYATWTLDLCLSAPPVLVVTRMRATLETFPALVKALIAAAHRISADSIEIWNLETGLVDVATQLGGNTCLREEHLPAVAWYGPEPPDNIEWTFNEKFPWC